MTTLYFFLFRLCICEHNGDAMLVQLKIIPMMLQPTKFSEITFDRHIMYIFSTFLIAITNYGYLFMAIKVLFYTFSIIFFFNYQNI